MLGKLSIPDPVINRTPIERYDVNGVKVYVKREDLCSPWPGPQFSKIRGLYAHMMDLKAAGWTTVGILDTIHSKAGWAVSYIANLLEMQAFVFFPVYKANVGKDAMQEQHRMAAYLGAILVPMEATAGYILAPRAKHMLEDMTGGAGYMLPVGLKLKDAIKANAEEAIQTAYKFMDHGTWIVSTSSGTIAASLWYALDSIPGSGAKLICHLGYSRPERSIKEYISKMACPVDERLAIIDEGYEYKDAVDYPAPFPCNPHYDLKAWKWLNSQDLATMEKPILFWNVGA